MKKFYVMMIAAVSVLCGTANAQRTFDIGRALDAGKDLVGATAGISEKEEIQIGRELAGRMLGAVELVNDENVQAYVNRVGRWVASQSERPDLPWRFGVANAGNVNAMAMPGGTILITRGLYDLLDNEAQLAGVLGHEIAHVVKRHHVNVMRQQRGVSFVANVAAARTGNNMMGQQALNFFKELFISGLDKNSEFDADATGVILAARAGYNAFGLAEVLHKIGARGKDPSVADLFSSHPSPAERLTKLGELLTPRLANLPSGAEPDITPVSARAGAPRAGPAPAATGARALTNEGTVEAPAEAPAQKPAAGGINPGSILKGIFGR